MNCCSVKNLSRANSFSNWVNYITDAATLCFTFKFLSSLLLNVLIEIHTFNQVVTVISCCLIAIVVGYSS